MSRLLLVALLLIACNSHKDFSKVRNGMTEREVVEAVGKPKEKVKMPMSIVWWRYTDKENHVVVMEGGNVTNVISQGDRGVFREKMDSLRAAHKDSL
ncbi:MAG: hypothetical protein NVS9B7_14020 [Flavisolibacter sp.]